MINNNFGNVEPGQRIKEINSLLRILNADEQIKQLGETEKMLKQSIEEGWGDKDFEERKLKIIYKRAMDLGVEKFRLEEEKRKLLKELALPRKPILEYEE